MWLRSKCCEKKNNNKVTNGDPNDSGESKDNQEKFNVMMEKYRKLHKMEHYIDDKFKRQIFKEYRFKYLRETE